MGMERCRGRPRACPNDIGQPCWEEGNHRGLPLRAGGDRLGFMIEELPVLSSEFAWFASPGCARVRFGG
jgi:hypothetical protein